MGNFSVEVRSDESFEKALRRFTSKIRKTGLLRGLKKRRFYTKPSVQKKINRQKSIRRQQKAARMARPVLSVERAVVSMNAVVPVDAVRVRLRLPG